MSVEWLNIKQMYENGVAISEIARRTGRDHKTIRKWIQSDGPPKKVRRRRSSKLDKYKEYIISRMQEDVLNATVIYDEIKDKGYKGKITILRDFIQQYRPVLTAQATMKYETRSGEQAQVDWAHFGYIIDLDGTRRRPLHIPLQTVHLLRNKLSTESVINRPPVTFHSVHLFQNKLSI